MKINRLLLATLCLFVAFATSAKEPLRVAKIFSDHMVLQQECSAPVWGWAEPNAKVAVKASWSKHHYSTKADSKGFWRIKLATPSYGGTHSLKISCGKERVLLSDILIGEVWVCAGQSNMEMPIEGFVRYNQPCDNTAEHCLEANNFGDRIRIFTVPKTASDYAPAEDLTSGAWQRSSAESCASCSAVAYHFAHTLNTATEIPTGVIVVAWEGTPIRPWTPRDSYEKVLGELEKEGVVDNDLYTKRTAYSKPHKGRPTCAGAIYNGMINPIKGFASRGFLWYQGCSNKRDFRFYNRLQSTMVARWRAEWGDTDAKMPFYYVLIAPYARGENGYTRGYFVENQASVAKITPNCTFASAETYGSKVCIHPSNKRPIGQQLAMLAMSNTYNIKGIEAGVPEVVNISLSEQKYIVEIAPNKLLTTPPHEAVTGFEVAGKDRVFHTATAKIVGNTIEVYIPQEVSSPQSLRYSFHDYGEGNIRNNEGFPLIPFRTDDWPL